MYTDLVEWCKILNYENDKINNDLNLGKNGNENKMNYLFIKSIFRK